jgi:hypothetical protein
MTTSSVITVLLHVWQGLYRMLKAKKKVRYLMKKKYEKQLDW